MFLFELRLFGKKSDRKDIVFDIIRITREMMKSLLPGEGSLYFYYYFNDTNLYAGTIGCKKYYINGMQTPF